jgi:phosphonoacetaldehyde hydrolase
MNFLLKGNPLMSSFIPQFFSTEPLKAVVLDWAGTAVDYGCMGPADVFVRVFAAFDIAVTMAEAMQFMGLEKKEHIRRMCKLPGVAQQWKEKHGRLPDERDVARFYGKTEPMMMTSIVSHADPIPGLLQFVDAMHARNIKIGSCTDYTAPMMDVLVPEAAKRGYTPDCTVCASDVPAGRPFPWMCYQNAFRLQIYSVESMVKIGDTLSDIAEGRNAGMWTVGLTRSGNELGLTEAQANALPREELEQRLSTIEARMQDAGAHYVVEGIWDCLDVIDDISRRLENGDHPNGSCC